MCFSLLTSELEESLPIDPKEVVSFVETFPDKVKKVAITLALAVAAFLIGIQIIRILRRIVRKTLTKANVENAAVSFIDSFMKAALYILLIMVISSAVGWHVANLVALLLGSASVAVGLAIQGSLSNLAGGILILVLKPFRVGDYIIEGESQIEGTVSEIQIFYTKLQTLDNRTVVLPNGSLANHSLINVTLQPERRLDLVIGVSYRADLKKTKEVLLRVLKEDEYVLKNLEMQVFVSELGNSSVEMGIRCWLLQNDYWSGRFRILENCKLALDEAGIEIPYNQLDIHVQSDK